MSRNVIAWRLQYHKNVIIIMLKINLQAERDVYSSPLIRGLRQGRVLARYCQYGMTVQETQIGTTESTKV